MFRVVIVIGIGIMIGIDVVIGIDVMVDIGIGIDVMVGIMIGITDEQSEQTGHLEEGKEHGDRECDGIRQVCPDEKRRQSVHWILAMAAEERRRCMEVQKMPGMRAFRSGG